MRQAIKFAVKYLVADMAKLTVDLLSPVLRTFPLDLPTAEQVVMVIGARYQGRNVTTVAAGAYTAQEIDRITRTIEDAVNTVLERAGEAAPDEDDLGKYLQALAPALAAYVPPTDAPAPAPEPTAETELAEG